MPCFGRRKTDGMHATPEVLRSLGALYAIPATLRGAQAEEAMREHFERAVALAVLDHPILQVGLVGESTKNPVWVRLERLDLRHHIQWLTIVASGSNDQEKTPLSSSRLMDAVLEDTIKAQHDMPYPDLETRPGWKMVVLHSPNLDYVEAFFGVSHANADGESAKFFQQTLLEKLNLIRSCCASSSASSSVSSTPPGHDAPSSGLQQLQGQILTLAPMSASSFTPAHEALVSLSLSPAWVASVALKEMLPSWLRSHPLQVLDWAPQKSVPIRTALRLIHVDAAALRCVLKACRRHETTLTGLIQAMAVTSLAMRTRAPSPTTSSTGPRRSKKSPTAPAPIVMGTPVSMHRYIRPSAAAANPDRVMVNSVTYCFHPYHGRRLATLYDLAGKVSQDDDDDGANHDKTCRADNAATNAKRLEDALWEQAARVRRQLAAKLAQGTRNDLTGLLRFVSDVRGRVGAEMTGPERPRDVTVEVSNLGVMDGEVTSTPTRSKGEDKNKTMPVPHMQTEIETDERSLASVVGEKEAVRDFGHVAGTAPAAHEGEEEGEAEADENADKWTIERAMFTQSGIPHGVGLVISPIAVKGKGLTIAVNWQDGLIDEGVASGLAADLEAWLGSLGREERMSFSNYSKAKAG